MLLVVSANIQYYSLWITSILAGGTTPDLFSAANPRNESTTNSSHSLGDLSSYSTIGSDQTGISWSWPNYQDDPGEDSIHATRLHIFRNSDFYKIQLIHSLSDVSSTLDVVTDYRSMETNDAPTDSRQTQLCLIAWIFTGMAIITVLTKLFTTVVIFRRPGWDDLLILLSLIGSIVASALVQASADLGLGRHTAAVAAEPGGLQRMVKTKILQVVGYR
jgi:hypothetical protein